MGRPRKPIEILKETKQFRKSRHEFLNGSLKAPLIEDIPEPKMDMNADGLNEYYRLCYELKKLRILSEIDLSIIELAGYYYGVFVENITYINEKYGTISKYLDGQTGKKAFVYESMNNAFKSYVEVGSKFGLSPVARLNIKAPEEKGKDELEDFMLKCVK